MELRKAGRIESKAERQHREQVLIELGEITSAWAQRVANDLRMENSAFARVHILPFGSYRLGVNAPSADIDTVLVVPKHFKRGRDFFGSVDAMLGQRWASKPKNILANVLQGDSRTTGLAQSYTGRRCAHAYHDLYALSTLI